MANEKNQLQVNFSEMLTDKLTSVEEALPKDFNRARFVQNALSVLNDKPELAQVNKQQLVLGLVRGAYMGLDFAQNECYLIPYQNSVQFQYSYKGLCKFVKKYSIRKIKDLYAKLVRQGDDFIEKITDGQPSIDFKPLPFNDGEIIGVFAICLYEDGGMDYEVMTTKEVNDVRNNYSKASNSKAWKSSWGEQAKKTALRRLCKHIETDFESTEALKSYEDGSDAEFGKPVPSNIVADPFAEQEEIIVESVDVTEPDGSLDDELPF